MDLLPPARQPQKSAAVGQVSGPGQDPEPRRHCRKRRGCRAPPDHRPLGRRHGTEGTQGLCAGHTGRAPQRVSEDGATGDRECGQHREGHCQAACADHRCSQDDHF